jgi:uncharacterized membrane protein YbhN (UPF0104 family)
MKAFYLGVSFATLISLFVLGPAFGRAILIRISRRREWSDSTQHIALGLCTMSAIIGMLFVYGLIWKANPRLASWYMWIEELPVYGTVDVGGSVVIANEPLKVEVENEPLSVKVER